MIDEREQERQARMGGKEKGSLRPRLTWALALLVLGAWSQMVLGRQVERLRAGRQVELGRPLEKFPRTIGLWTGTDLAVNPVIVKDIKIDDYLQRTYVHPSGEKVVLWMSYSKRSTDQYHYPTVCMQGSGWTEDEASRQRVIAFTGQETDPTDGTEQTISVPVMRMLFNKTRQRQYVYYWYYLIGEDSIDRVMRRFSQSARAFLRGRRNASLTIEVFSQSAQPNQPLIDELVREIAREMNGWMPTGTEAACDLGADY